MNNNILDKLKNLKKTNKQNFKAMVLNDFELNFLLEQSFLVQDNKILVKYAIIKNYANQQTFDSIIIHLINKVRTIISNYDSFEMHINLENYSMTSHERIKNIYPKLFKACENDNILFSEKLICLNVYNCPIILRTLNSFFAPFINPTASNKITLYNKIDSKEMLLKLGI
jgi:hypothetical protein